MRWVSHIAVFRECTHEETVTFLEGASHIDKKEKKIFLIYKEIQKGAVAKSYITNGLRIYD
jgi:hypothetical protein